MAKILGLDLGTNSIGWAVVDKESNSIDDCGVRIFPAGVNDAGTAKEESKNATRREKRQSRRQYYRKRLRKVKLLRLLIQQRMCPLSIDEVIQWKNTEIFPSSDKFKEWLKLNPYQLRAKAIEKEISLMELGRIFYHFIQRRGFLSSRKSTEEGKIFEGKENMVGIDDTRKQIENNTLGNYLNSILPKENQTYGAVRDENGKELRARARYTLRDMYVSEFESIWKRQSPHLGLDFIEIKNKRIRYLKGELTNNRNSKRIDYLRTKYGKDNLEIETIIKNEGSLHKVTTSEYILLKKALAGEIEVDTNNQLKHKTQESILFWQRPLRSQKSLLVKCSFEINKTPVPVSHPDFELFRAYQFVNNIEYGTKQKLTDEQREEVIGFIKSKKAAFKFSEIPKKLNLSYEHFNYADDTPVAGCPTIAQLSKLFDDNVWSENYVEIWHSFLFFDDNKKLIKQLSDKFKLKEKYYEVITGKMNEETGKRTPGITLKDDYANVSLKAIFNILPFLRKGYSYSDATILGGVRNAFGLIKEGNDTFTSRYDKYFEEFHDEIEKNIIKIIRDKTNKEGDAINKIKKYLSDPDNNLGFSSNDKTFKKLYHHSQKIEKKEPKDDFDEIEDLRNPIVQQGVNETSRLVKQLMKKYGKFNQIKVELGRDLKHGKKKRQEVGFRINENLKLNTAARETLTEYGLAHTRDNIQKYLLWQELQAKNGTALCPYTGITIGINDVLGNENKIQIEHIIPKSISLDDSFANKTLCDATFNREKGEKTPRQFYTKNSKSEHWGVKSWEELEQRAFKLLPYAKAKRFTSKKEEWDKGEFIERQLNDTRYISKKTAEILSVVCNDVQVLPGGLTSELRHLWGLNNILEPVKNLGKHTFEVDEDKKTEYYAITNKEKEIQALYKKYNDKPLTDDDETTISGFIKKGIFSSKYIKLKVNDLDLPDGEYWAIVKLSDKPELTRIFIDKPETKENEIIIKGKIDKKFFNNESLKRKLKTDLENGRYWAKFNVTDTKLVIPEKGKQPQNKKGIVLFGEVKEGVFKSYIYECETNMVDGKYWAVIDLDIENVEYLSAIGQRPDPNEQQIIIEGTVSDEGIYTSELDPEHSINTNEKSGKYWALFEIVHEISEFTAIKNSEPEIEKDQQIIEGSVWVDKSTGEIKFDPKKNRDDHRHHAIDAIAIALNEQSYLQKLSKYNADKEDKKRGIESEKPQFEEPWDGFYYDAKEAASRILISHKQNKNSLSNISKMIVKDGKAIKAKGKAVRGQLHKENVYGKRQAPNSEEAYHRRKSISELTSEKHFDKIVDPVIKKIIINAKREESEKNIQIELLEKQLKNATEIKEKEIKTRIEEIKEEINLLYTLPNKKGEPVPIKKVRVKEKIGNAQALKSRLSINQYVNPRNNHHVIIYIDDEGNLNENVVTLWEVVERKKQGQAVFQLPPAEINKPTPKEIITTLQINDMYILGLTDEEYQDNKNNYSFLSEYLYKVQKISGGDYFFEICFRHHLDSRPDGEAKANYRYIKNFGDGTTGWKTLKPIKIKISVLGKIQGIEKKDIKSYALT